jgi:2-polyprenyl-3-methyl-5-hydroxy-6-metoxy-1,4-benzoquinol methylase
MNDSVRERQLVDSWDANAAAWSAVIQQGQIESRRVATDAAVVEVVTALQPRRVLDLGCGEGWLTRALTEAGFSVVGVDGSSALITTARTTSNASFHVLSYETIIAEPSLLDGPYDAIVCNFSLLGAQIESLLRAIRGALQPNGNLVIQTVHPWTAGGNAAYADGWRTETFDSFGTAFPSPMPWYFRTIGSWISVLQAAAFNLAQLNEPTHPATGRPVSLLLVARPRAEDA